jgi:hypothetical protein
MEATDETNRDTKQLISKTYFPFSGDRLNSSPPTSGKNSIAIGYRLQALGLCAPTGDTLPYFSFHCGPSRLAGKVTDT